MTSARHDDGKDVLYFLPDLSQGGVQRVISLLALQIQEFGLRASVVTLAADNATPLARRLTAAGIPITTLGLSGRIDRSALSRTRQVISSLQPSLVHFHGHTYRYVAPLAGHFPDTPFLFTLHEEMSWSWFQADNLLRWWLLARNKRIHVSAVSQSSKRAATKTIGMNVHHVIPNAVEGPDSNALSTFTRRQASSTIPSEPFTFCMLARLVPRKGHATLIEAMHKLVRTNPRARLLLVGDGRLRPALERRVNALALTDKIMFAGNSDDPYSILANCDALVHPSETEASSLCCMEAMRLGMPVIASNIGALREILDSETTGILAHVSDPGSFSHEMSRVIANPQWAMELGRRGREVANARYSPLRLGLNYLSVYKYHSSQIKVCPPISKPDSSPSSPPPTTRASI